MRVTDPQQVVCTPDPYEDVWDLYVVLGDRRDTARILSTDLEPDPGGGLGLILDGGSGPDVLHTRVSSVKIYGRAGADRIDALDAHSHPRDNLISCGRGRDRALVDRTFYAVGGSCERLTRRRRQLLVTPRGASAPIPRRRPWSPLRRAACG